MQSIVEQRDDIVIFTIKNERIEGDSSVQLKAKMLILAQPDLEALLIDLTAVKTIDSSGIGAFLLAKRQLSENGSPVVLCGVNDFIKSLMSITRLDSQFLFFASVDEAIQEMTEEEQE